MPGRDIDMLFMIDNSTGGKTAQANLTRNFPTFVTALRMIQGGLPNLHVAVITSDLGGGDGSIGQCNATGGDKGAFQTAPRGTTCQRGSSGLASGETFISDVGGVRNYTGNLEDVFSCIAALGDQGCGMEQPLAAIARALGADGQPAPPENQGFLRPNAYLLIFILTDEDDCSAPVGTTLFDTATNNTLASALGPLQSYRCNEFGHLCGGVKPPRLAPTGSVNDVVTLDGCVSAEGAGMLIPVSTLVEQIRSVKPYPDEQILVAAITGPSAPYVVHWRSPPITDNGPWPYLGPSCQSSTGDGEYGDPSVRITQWVGAFGANGQSYDICGGQYANALSAAAARLAPLFSPPAQ